MKYLFVAAFALFLFSACKKDNPVQKSHFDYLTAHGWKYNKYYTNYAGPSNLGTLLYERGKENNTQNLDNDISTFYADNTVDEIDATGNHILGTWQFNKDQTVITVKNSYG